MKTINQLSERKQQELKASLDSAVKAGLQFMNLINQLNHVSVQLDDKGRKALVFLLEDVPNMCELDSQCAFLLAELPEPSEVESLNLRQFNQLVKLIQSVHIKGRQNLLDLHNAIVVFEQAADVINKMQQDQKVLSDEYARTLTSYGKLCKNYDIMPENVDEIVENIFNEQLKASENKEEKEESQEKENSEDDRESTDKDTTEKTEVEESSEEETKE